MNIRTAKPTDACRLAEIHVRGWQFTYKNILPNAYLSKLSVEERALKWSEQLRTKDPETFHIVAELGDNHVIGFASARPEQTVMPRHWGELSAIYVLSRYHKQGIGTALFNEVVARLKKQGYTGMISWMLAENPAGAFYRKLGGTQQGAKVELIGGVMKEMTAYEWTFICKNCGRPIETSSNPIDDQGADDDDMDQIDYKPPAEDSNDWVDDDFEPND